MKKLFFSLVVLTAFSSLGFAAVGAPRDTRGESLATVDFVGAETSLVDASTGTNHVKILTGRGIVYGVIASSIPASNYIVFRDSATSNAASSTVTIVYANGSGANASGANTSVVIKFPVPIKFTNGIVYRLGAAPAATGESSWTIIYRPLAATE